MADAAPTTGTLDELPAARQGGALSPRQVLHLQRIVGNAATQRAILREDKHRPGPSGGAPLLLREPMLVVQRNDPTIKAETQAPAATNRIAFVREEGLNLREGADQKAKSLSQMKFGQRVHILDDPSPQPDWKKITVLGQTGYAFAPRIHTPPEHLIQKDPGMSMVKVKPGQTFWGLVKEMYGIQGNEGTPDQNINHFINAIRAVNKPEAFNIKTDTLDDIGNAVVPGRDASDTYLIAGVDLWIPSFGVAAAMDVGSGTVTGEISRIIKKIQQKIEDFTTACGLAGKYIPGAIAQHAGEVGESLLNGLIEFAKDAAKILAISTAVGALIGALFGGVGALPGAAIGFEIGLLILQYYGLAMLIEAVLGIAGSLLSQLGLFINLVWTANGDKKQLEEAGKALADALGILVSAALVALAAYLLKKGGESLGKTKFARTVGEKPLAQWIKQRQQMTTTREVLKGREPVKPIEPVTANPAKAFVDDIVRNPKSVSGKSATDIAKQFNDAGFKATIEQSTKKGTSGKAVQVRITGHPEITNIQVHPGGGRHTAAGVPYWKISTNTQGKIWVVPKSFKGAGELGGKVILYE